MDVIEHKGEKLYLKKGIFGWGVVEPIIDPENPEEKWYRRWRWKGFLNKKGFVTLAFVLILLLFSYLAFQEQINNYKLVTQNPCKFCDSCQDYALGFASKFNQGGKIPEINLSKFMVEDNG